MSRSRIISALSIPALVAVLMAHPDVARADTRGVEVTCGAGQTASVQTVGNAYRVRCIDSGYVASRGAASAPVARRVAYTQRPATRYVYVEKPRRSWKKSAVIIGGSTAAGAGVGKLVGGSAKKGAVIGGVGGVVYDLATRNK